MSAAEGAGSADLPPDHEGLAGPALPVGGEAWSAPPSPDDGQVALNPGVLDGVSPDRDVGVVKARPRDAVVSLLSGEQIEFTCPAGKHTTADEMLMFALDGFKIGREVTGVFALFCVSASLTVQFKAHHEPFKILRKWPELLALYTTSGDPADEAPMLYLKRSELCHQGIERKQTDSRVIELLFQEMTFNVVYSFYPCDADEAARLAALHLAIDTSDAEGPPSKDDVALSEGCQLPDHLRKKVPGRKWKKAVLDAYDELRFDAGHPGKHALMLQYLKLGRKWNFYGSVFFYGHVEPPPAKGVVLREQPDELVRVGVNLDGIHVVSDKNNVLVLSLGYSELQYNSFDADDEVSDASFVIEYSDDGVRDVAAEGAGADGEDKLLSSQKSELVIWTPQARMIDLLVSQYIEALGDWEEHLKARKLEKTASYRPNANVRGRKAGAADEGPKGFFTLSRFMSKRKTRSEPPVVSATAARPSEPTSI
mmetsp:Transcript_35895/g.94091  ORF Transcript_35895/g.94091 Transcript_35895/m.94091 type:complete len:481 (+) Transcript_35895:28-1470(+)